MSPKLIAETNPMATVRQTTLVGPSRRGPLDAPNLTRVTASNARTSRAKASRAKASRARRTVQTEKTLNEELQDSIDLHAPVKRYKGDAGQYIQTRNGKHIRLMNATNKATPAGEIYYEKLKVPPPSLYDYDQPLLNDEWITARDGKKIHVRKRGADGRWKILKTGVDYFKYNRSEYAPRVNVFVAKDPSHVEGAPEGVWTVVRPRNGLKSPIPGYPTMSVSQVRQTMAGKNSLLALPGPPSDDGQHLHHAEVKAAAAVILRKLPTLLAHDGRRYHTLYYRSDVWYVWDGGEVSVEERRTNFWDDQPTTTEVILNRPLRSYAMPDGMWRPYDMHPDTFVEHEHGCAVQMLFRNFTKRPSGAMQRAGIKGRVPIFTIAEISTEMDLSFDELGYMSERWPYTTGWREDGITSHMIVHFCTRQSSRGFPVRCIIFQNGHKMFEYKSENATEHSATIVFGVHNNHAYYYKDGKQVASHMTTSSNAIQDEYTRKKIREPCPGAAHPPYSTWLEEWQLNFEDGFLAHAVKQHKEKATIYFSARPDFCDLDEVILEADKHIQRLKGTDRCFSYRRIYGSDPNTLVAIQFDAKDTPRLFLKRVPAEADILDHIAKKMSMVYRGESMAAFAENLRLFSMKRRRGIPDEILATMRSQNCAECDEPATEVDHILPISEGGTNDIGNLQALCETCHAAKTRNERMSNYASAGYSEMSTDILDAFVASPKPTQLVFGDGKMGCLEMDGVNCRRWAVQKTDFPLPVACVLDKIKPFVPGTIVDFVFLDAGPPDVDDYENFAAYHGPRWYTYDFARYVVMTSIRNGEGDIITTYNCIASFTASEHIQPEAAASMYDNMEDTFLDALANSSLQRIYQLEIFDCDDATRITPEKTKFFKKLCLAMQGSWLVPHQYSWQCVESTTRDDVIGPIHSFSELGNGVCRYNTCVETLGNRSMYLIGLCALNTEQLIVCKSIRLAKQMGRVVHGVLVDGVLIAGTTKKLDAEIKAWVRPDGTQVVKIKRDDDNKIVLKTAPNNKPYQRHVPAVESKWRSGEYTMTGNGTQLLWPHGGGQSIFQVATPRPWHNMGAFGSWLFEPRFVFERNWRNMSEGPGIGDCTPQDTYQDEVAEAAFQNGGAIITGGGGAGKSHTIRKLKAKYDAIGVRVDVVAFTHVQAANIDGQTLLHDIHNNSLCKRRVLIIDEGGQVPISLWAVVATFKFTGSRIFVFGDFAGQLPPIADQRRFDLWKGISTSDFMHDLCGGLHAKLQKFRRRKKTATGYEVADYGHFSFVQSIEPSPVGPEELHGAAELARARYPIYRKVDEYATTLTMTNAHRKVVNARINKRMAPAGAILVPYEGRVESAQPFLVWPGLLLQSAVTTRTKTLAMKNALRYRVRSVTADTTEVIQIDDKNEEDPTKISTMPTKELSAKMRLTYAITYDSSQSRTLHGGVRLTQTRHPYMTLRRLICGLGRAPLGADVEVE